MKYNIEVFKLFIFFQYGAQRAEVSAIEKEETKALDKDEEQTTDHNDTAAQQKELEEDEDEEGLC